MAANILSAASAVDYTGHYELTDESAGQVFSLDIEQTMAKADVSFSTSMADGSGAAPDGSGTGVVKNKVLTFKFKDSFDNEGSGTLSLRNGSYRLKMELATVLEPRAARLYGDLILKKTASKPAQL